MQFQVPQFIEHEAKIIGPFTFTQFIYIGFAGAAAFFLYFILPISFFFIVAIILGAVGFGLAFIKVAGKSLPFLLLDIFNFSISPKTYIWKRGRVKRSVEPKRVLKRKEVQPIAKIKQEGQGRISSLAVKIETKN